MGEDENCDRGDDHEALKQWRNEVRDLVVDAGFIENKILSQAAMLARAHFPEVFNDPGVLPHERAQFVMRIADNVRTHYTRILVDEESAK